MNRAKCFWARQNFRLMIVPGVVLLLAFGKAGWAAENESVQYFKMLSTIEYTGKGQFKNQVETLFTVRKQSLSDDKVRYFLSTDDFDLVEGNQDFSQQSSLAELSFVIDRKTRLLSEGGEDLVLFEMVNNQCVRSLKKVTKKNIGKTWKQSFDLPFLNHLLPGELKFTLTAIQLKTEIFGEAFGEIIAVRALSEPFVIKATKEGGGTGPIHTRINAVYLFDPEIEDIYLSISVFEATTNINGFKEKLRHEVATYKTDATGVSVAMSGLGKKFEKFVRKLGLKKKSLKVVKESPLPQWVQYEGSAAAQVANICAAAACEGALNPVVTVCIPAARTVALQSAGKLATVSGLGSVSSLLATSVPAVGGLKIAAAPAFMGVGIGTAGAIGGGTAIAVAAGGSSGGSSSRSPASP